MLFVDAKCCCFNSIVVYKQMSTVDFVEAPLGWTFHAELKLFTLLLVLPKYMTCLIESYLKGSCSVQTVRVCHRGFASPKLLHPVVFIGSTGRESCPPPARLSSLTDSPAHISNSIPVQRTQLHTSAPLTGSHLKLILTLSGKQAHSPGESFRQAVEFTVMRG